MRRTNTCHPSALTRTVYYDLSHPPPTYIDRPAGPRALAAGTANGHAGPPPGPSPLGPPNYSWRLPDGSYNSIAIPDMGRAGSHYTRTVQGRHPVSDTDRPDPGLVFDTLLKRDKVRSLIARARGADEQSLWSTQRGCRA